MSIPQNVANIIRLIREPGARQRRLGHEEIEVLVSYIESTAGEIAGARACGDCGVVFASSECPMCHPLEFNGLRTYLGERSEPGVACDDCGAVFSKAYADESCPVCQAKSEVLDTMVNGPKVPMEHLGAIETMNRVSTILESLTQEKLEKELPQAEGHVLDLLAANFGARRWGINGTPTESDAEFRERLRRCLLNVNGDERPAGAPADDAGPYRTPVEVEAAARGEGTDMAFESKHHEPCGCEESTALHVRIADLLAQVQAKGDEATKFRAQRDVLQETVKRLSMDPRPADKAQRPSLPTESDALSMRMHLNYQNLVLATCRALNVQDIESLPLAAERIAATMFDYQQQIVRLSEWLRDHGLRPWESTKLAVDVAIEKLKEFQTQRDEAQSARHAAAFENAKEIDAIRKTLKDAGVAFRRLYDAAVPFYNKGGGYDPLPTITNGHIERLSSALILSAESLAACEKR